MKAARLQVMGAVAGLIGVWGMVAGGCASEQQKKGHELYAHYCLHCHGENGRQNEGFNWSSMPDPKPKDLSNKSEMSTFKDEDIFNTVSRDMKDTSPGGDKIGDDDFAVPTMPTFKYTLSEEEIWAIVGYVRTLHGMKLEFKVEERKKELAEALKSAQTKFDESKAAYEAAEKKASEEAEKKSAALKKDVDVDESSYAKEQEAMGKAKKELDAAQMAVTNFTSRPGKGTSVARPDLPVKGDLTAVQDLGKRLYFNKYGCNGCHSIGEDGGKVGPALDRAGFRLNGTWIYRWVKNPQAMKPETRMPALGLSDADAKAVTIYLGTLRAPRAEPASDKPAS
ncbi:putative dihem cytochrome c [Nitrospira sp. KM1]|uniref:c-type cytochrome n=1 Tax=Nitrospira sp. KM1 TaxID=1936990 RepID=UPI0013A78E3D|nr:c-type cytochrome [Nitrospira sp. KM1]BCA55945.1 putative dihem cytochrome c [Nitrospira sp. KM1]